MTLFSDLSPFQRDPLSLLEKKGSSANSSFVKLNLGLKPVFLLTEPKYIRTILKADEDYIDKGDVVKKLRKIIGDSSLTIKGAEYKNRRKLIHSHLQEGMKDNYLSALNDIINQTLWKVSLLKAFSVPEMMSLISLRSICFLLFGKNILTASDENALINAIALVENDITREIFQVLPLSPISYLRRKKRVQLIRNLIQIVVRRAMKEAPRDALLKNLLDLGLSDKQLYDEILFLLLAGYHTTGAAASWLIYHLAQDSILHNKIANEAKQLGKFEENIQANSLKKMNYSRKAVLEILRLYPSAYWLSRECMKTVTFSNYQFKKGTTFIISPWHLHRDKRYWDEPKEFNPNRNFFENKSYIPFGVGPRACLGMNIALLEMQLIAFKISSLFEISVPQFSTPLHPKPCVTLVAPNFNIEINLKHEGGCENSDAA